MNVVAQAASDTERRLLQSIVEVARHVFSAAAASTFLIDPITSELVFQAVAGEGNETLVGRRFPAGTGIAGCVAASGQAMLLDDLQISEEFDAEAAESTGYIPQCIIAAPLFNADLCIGVLEVLDRSAHVGRELDDINTLTMLAEQAAIGLELHTRLNRGDSGDRAKQVLHYLNEARKVLENIHD